MTTEKNRSFHSIRELDIDIGLCQSGDHPAPSPGGRNGAQTRWFRRA
jgi:hypothetical protein